MPGSVHKHKIDAIQAARASALRNAAFFAILDSNQEDVTRDVG